MPQEMRTIHVQVYRSVQNDGGGTQEGMYEEYEVPHEERMTILNALDYIYQNYSRDLSFYYSCRIGKCLGCFVDVNGKSKLACTTLVKDGMRIGPRKRLKIIKDLLADFH